MIPLGLEDPAPENIDQWTMCIKVETKPRYLSILLLGILMMKSYSNLNLIGTALDK